MRAFILFSLCVAAVYAGPSSSLRIAGGTEASIEQYPNLVAILYTPDFVTNTQQCGGFILNQRSVATAASCVTQTGVVRWTIRAGSSYGNSGGVLYNLLLMIIHTEFDNDYKTNNIAILRVANAIVYSNVIQPSRIAGELYIVPDNQRVVAVGWGKNEDGEKSEQLRQVELVTINQGVCGQAYVETETKVTDAMLCAGWVDGGRGQCEGDLGSPLFHTDVVIGIASHAEECGSANYPSVNTRVNSFVWWLQNNA
ncbi:trypsin CFT-1-like [Anticarsia gemmatalis]|uniref:trypsin CFT-1-like n=1 Tax=Anticarsia gemmatalis TaxID=129554 RepID=UPI003F7749C6